MMPRWPRRPLPVPGGRISGRVHAPSRKLRILVAFGTRPEALKLYPVISLLRERPHEFRTIVVATAQHRELLDQVLGVLPLRAHYDLDIMTSGQTLSGITRQTIQRLDPILERTRPDMVLVQGDTTTTFSVGLAAFYRKIPVGHVEAGLRTQDRYNPFPEEVNRHLTSVLASLHLAPTAQARTNLLSESVPDASIFVTGNTIVDSLRQVSGVLTQRHAIPVHSRNASMPLVLVTAHRRENFGEPLRQICRAMARLAGSGRCHIVFPVHPNPEVREAVNSILRDSPNLQLCEPLPYGSFLWTLRASSLVITDSGGVQEEAVALGIPTLVTRTTTERPEGITAGIATLVGVDTDRIVRTADRVLSRRTAGRTGPAKSRVYGDGHASKRVVEALRFHFGLRTRRPADYHP